jgi:hypothetical protein
LRLARFNYILIIWLLCCKHFIKYQNA